MVTGFAEEVGKSLVAHPDGAKATLTGSEEAGSRLLPQRDIADAVLEKLTSALDGPRLGDPFDTGTRIGPISNQTQFEKIPSFIEVVREQGAREQGARCAHGAAGMGVAS